LQRETEQISARSVLGAFAVLGLAINARAVIFAGIATVGLLYFLRAMRSDALVTGRALRRIGALALILLAISGPVSDLTHRGHRQASARKGLPGHHDPHNASNLAATRGDRSLQGQLENRGAFGAYDEHYIANPMLPARPDQSL